jgi:hypothetical protein
MQPTDCGSEMFDTLDKYSGGYHFYIMDRNTEHCPYFVFTSYGG